MISEILMDAIGNIGDEYIDEYVNLRSGYKNKRTNLNRIWIVVSAACVCLVVIATAYVIKSSNNNPETELTHNHTDSPHYVVEVTDEPIYAVTKEPTMVPKVNPTNIPTNKPTETITENPSVIVTSEPDTFNEQVTEAPIEKDWQSEWTYFIAHLDSEQGKGVTAHPDEKIYEKYNSNAKPHYADEYFIENSLWDFKLNLNGGLYIAHQSKIAKENIGAYLQDVELNICERRLKYYNFNETISVFSINNISTNAAVAISIGPDEYCLFVNLNYKPNSFNEFVSSFNLIQAVDLKEMAYFDELGNVTSVNGISDDTYIWNILLENATSIAEADTSNLNSVINMSVDSDFYSFYDVSFSIYNEGYMYFNILGNRICFTIDSDKAINQLNGKEQ